MQYICLIYSNEADEATQSQEEWGAVMAEYNAFTKSARDAGVMVSGEAFHPTKDARTVHATNGSASVSAGPAVATSIQLGGMYILETPDIDTAVAWAAKIPGARHGKVEVRPLVDFSLS
ncbi:MAG: YciI family protein [Chloroflexi bacterium]|nr:YciI family protein [Chloroflexota bacterium]